MIFHQIKAGGDRNFAYLVADKAGGTAALIDPPPNAERYHDLVEKDRLQVAYVIITHGHGDHTWGVAEARRRYGAKVVAHSSMLHEVDVRVDDGDTLALGDAELSFIYTPGHSDDHICVRCGQKLITGDCLFVGKVGGTDLGEGARKEYHSLHEKLMKLDPAIEIYPGHDYGVAPSSTIGHEKATNPFIQRESFEAFLDLKANWIEYKKKHGIK